MPCDILSFFRSRSTIALLAGGAIAALLLSGGVARSGDTQVYKTVDEHGNIVYTDRPSSPDMRKSTVRFHEPSEKDLALVEQQSKAARAAESARLQQTAASSIARTQQANAEKEKQARCDNARNYYNRLQDASRIYQLDTQGNRVFLPDPEAEAKRTEAREAMETACAS
jgi:Domain of unknown function (DUF4124)